MCVGLRAKVANIENNMAVIDAGGVKRKVLPLQELQQMRRQRQIRSWRS